MVKQTTKVQELGYNPRKVDWRTRDGLKPTRYFEVGEKVQYGNHPNTEIVEVLQDGAIYVIRNYGTHLVYGQPKEYEQVQDANWYMLFKLGDHHPVKFTKPEAFRMQHSNRTIEGLISMVMGDHAGVDFTPEYQREYVWTEEDKVKLIDSIFNNVTIGLFVFAKLPYAPDSKTYEMVDGKQRLTTLVEFYEDRFPYKGVYFSQMNFHDINHFETYGISMGTLDEPTEKEKYAAFLAVNTFGRVMDEEHLAKVRADYEAMT